jgi:hypothetical protein
MVLTDRVEVLKRIRAWTGGGDKRHIFWLSSWTSAGKSTIARTVARENYDKNRLGMATRERSFERNMALPTDKFQQIRTQGESDLVTRALICR